MSASPTEIPISVLMDKLKERIAEDAMTIAMLRATIDYLESEESDVTPSGDSHAADATPVG